MSQRSLVLERIRAALADVRAVDASTASAPQYRTTSTTPAHELVSLFAERTRENGATVAFAEDAASVGRLVHAACARHGARRLLAAPRLPDAWLPDALSVVVDDLSFSAAALAAMPAVLTASALAIAETGTVALDGGPGQGRRAVTLLPDVHVCVVHADTIVGSVPEAIRASARGAGLLTLISGPSATSDIELERVEGVHGPRQLEVIVLHSEAAGIAS